MLREVDVAQVYIGARDGRPAGWAPSSVRAILLRSANHGVTVWNRSRKRTAQGTIHQQARPEADWISVDAPELRIVSDAQWSAVQARFAEHARLGYGAKRRPGTTTAKYLLSGLARCTCGSGIEARSWKADGRRVFVYSCAAHRRRGSTVCANDLAVPMDVADRAVLEMVEGYILEPSILAAAVDRAVSMIAGEGAADNRNALTTEAGAVRAQLARLVAALAEGGESSTLAAAIREREARLREIEAQMAAVRVAPLAFDRAKLRRELTARVRE